MKDTATTIPCCPICGEDLTESYEGDICCLVCLREFEQRGGDLVEIPTTMYM